MAFYIFLGVVVLIAGWLLARSHVMRAWLTGRTRDPFASGSNRDAAAKQGLEPSWNDDGGGRRGSRID